MSWAGEHYERRGCGGPRELWRRPAALRRRANASQTGREVWRTLKICAGGSASRGDAGGAVCPGRRPGCSPPPSLTPRLLSNPPTGARASTPTRPLQIQTTARRAGAPRPPGQSDKRGRSARAGEDGARLPGATPGLAIGPGNPAPSRIKPGGIRTDAAADTRTRRRTAARLTAAETRTRPKGPLTGERTSGTWCPAAAGGRP